VKYLKPILPGSGTLTCEGIAVQVGGRVGTAEGRVTGEDGTLYATGTTTCLILRQDP
jgi:acyl-coenzyme A thioesterase PaaI-like protein